MGRRPVAAGADLDSTDRRMLEVLLADSRTSIADLAQRVNVSRANAYARLKRLRDEGVIRAFTLDVDLRGSASASPSW